MKLRKSRIPRKGYIQIIPMIDVMFFLLATFMLASLSMQKLDSLQVNLPKGQAEKLSEVIADAGRSGPSATTPVATFRASTTE